MLGPGTHMLEAFYEDDISVKTLFVIEEKEEEEIKVPDTGNETHDNGGMLSVAMISLPVFGIVIIMAVGVKRLLNRNKFKW